MTPMQEQYNRIKAENPNTVVLFRLGDFYETFSDDAITVSKILGITLTGRGKDDNRQPLAGIPYHSLPTYLPKLIESGIKIAIAEQMEEPVPGKLVERQVTKVITPGTVLDENSLDSSKNNYIASVCLDNNLYVLSYCDISTGELRAFETTNINSLKIELNKITPSEIICIPQDYEKIKQFYNTRIEVISDEKVRKIDFRKSLCEQFEVNSLKGFGIEDKKEVIKTTSLLIEYLKECQKTEIKHIKNIRLYNYSNLMQLDAETIRNLELIYSMNSGTTDTTLFSILNKCVSSAGKRKLRKWIINPLINQEMIQERLNSVDFYFNNVIITSDVRDNLSRISDLERICGRLGVGSANPKDLQGIRNTIINIIEVIKILKKENENLSQRLRFLISNFEELEEEVLNKVSEIILKSIKEDPPAITTEGGFIKEGYNNEVDELRAIKQNSKQVLAEMQKSESERSGIPSLKISYNNVFGYYIEVTRTHLDKVPSDFIRKQTLANAERYITQELKEIEDKILSADEKLIKLESDLYKEIISNLASYIPSLLNAADIMAEIDVLVSFGYFAREYKYKKPEIIADKDSKVNIKIENGRHPVIEQLAENFIANSCTFTSDSFVQILTGPNMSGKSTFIRQTALLILLAQIGSFVPAQELSWKIIDRIFTRVGASDNLSKGESTFMVEMNETANILNNATENSLIILDEVGRGTSTYDGVAIAWSIIEYIHKKLKSNTLFATHYHELVELENKYKGIKNLNVEVIEENGEIMFKHKIIEGGANKSYGVHVAKLAGIPSEVINRAEQILKEFEGEEQKSIEEKPQKHEAKTGSGATKPRKIHPEQLGLI